MKLQRGDSGLVDEVEELFADQCGAACEQDLPPGSPTVAVPRTTALPDHHDELIAGRTLGYGIHDELPGRVGHQPSRASNRRALLHTPDSPCPSRSTNLVVVFAFVATLTVTLTGMVVGLVLGLARIGCATPAEAHLDIGQEAVRESLLPNLDQTRSTGLVTLPGAFVGASFGGASPAEAAQFQLVVLAGIALSMTTCGVIVSRVLGRSPFVNVARESP